VVRKVLSSIPDALCLCLDIKKAVKPVVDSHPTWSEHITPGTLQVFQDEESWNAISKQKSSKIFQNDEQPSFDSTDPSSLSSIQNSLVFSSSDEGKLRDKLIE
jgi:hypothetical protein